MVRHGQNPMKRRDRDKLLKDLRALLSQESRTGELLRRDRLEANAIIQERLQQIDALRNRISQLSEQLRISAAENQRLKQRRKRR